MDGVKGANASYWQNIGEGIKSLSLGLKISWRHFLLALQGKKRKPVGIVDTSYFKQKEGIVTLQYPSESFPVPDNGRYRLENEIEDCIVCDKCAKICPVNCIEIEAIKSPTEIRKASDGSSVRLYASKFDIDMAKCCFCGLCTTVCPTECLTMTKTYDFSEFSLADLNYEYSDLSPSQAEEKRKDYDKFMEEKAAKQAAQRTERAEETTKTTSSAPKIPGKVKAAAPKIPVPKKSDEEAEIKPKAVAPKIPVRKKKEEGNESKAIKPKIPLPKKNTDSDVKPKAINPKIPLPKKKDDEGEKNND